MAVVLLDGTQAYLGILNRGDEVTVKIDDLFDFSDAVQADGTVGNVSEGAVGDTAASSDASAEVGAGDAADVPEVGVSQEELDVAVEAGVGVTASSEDMCTVLINEQEILLPECILSLEGTAAYAPWTGYAAEGAALFSDCELTVGEAALELNQELAIVDEAGSVLVVERDGAFYCVDAASVAREPFEEPEPEEEADEGSGDQSGSYSYCEPQYSYTYSGGDSSSNDSPSTGDTDDGGSAPAPDASGSATTPSEEEVWTPAQK